MGALVVTGYRYEGGSEQPTHSHDHDQLSLVVAGTLIEEGAGGQVVCGPSSVILKEAGWRHRDAFGAGGALMVQLRMTRGSMASLLDPGRSLGPWAHWSTPQVTGPFLELAQEAVGVAQPVDESAPALADLLAILSAVPATPPRGQPPAWLRVVVDQIRTGWHPTMSTRTLAAGAGVHPVYLARAVRRWYGRGIGEELRRARLGAASLALVRAGHSISRVAHGVGYADHPHLTRSLRAATGIAPMRYRRMAGRLAALPAFHRR